MKPPRDSQRHIDCYVQHRVEERRQICEDEGIPFTPLDERRTQRAAREEAKSFDPNSLRAFYLQRDHARDRRH